MGIGVLVRSVAGTVVSQSCSLAVSRVIIADNGAVVFVRLPPPTASSPNVTMHCLHLPATAYLSLSASSSISLLVSVSGLWST